MHTEIILSCIKSQLSNLSCLDPPLPHLNHPPILLLSPTVLDETAQFEYDIMYIIYIRNIALSA